MEKIPFLILSLMCGIWALMAQQRSLTTIEALAMKVRLANVPVA